MKFIFIIFISLKLLFSFDITSECPNKIKIYSNAKHYQYRFKNYFDDYGCDLLPLYSILDRVDKEYLLDYIDNHKNVLPYLIKLSKKYPKFLELLANNDNFIDFLKASEYDKNFFNNIYFLLKYVSISKLKNGYLQYIYFAAYKEETSKKAYLSYLQLKKIPKEFLDGLIASYLSLNTQFPNVAKDKIIQDFLSLKLKLTYKELKTLCEYNPSYLISFLYNTKYVENFNNYQKELIFIYKKLFKKYNYDKRIVLSITFDIAPFLIDQKIPYTSAFKKVMSDFINNDFFLVLLSPDTPTPNPCNKENYFGLLGNNNLSKVLHFYNQEHNLYTKFLQDKGDVFSLFGLVNLFDKYYGYDEWKMIKGILLTPLFPKEYDISRRMLLVEQLERIDYFKTLSYKSDWNKYVQVDSDDSNSKNAPKYLYILFTSVGYQNSYSFLDEVLQDENEAQNDLETLSNYSIEELQEHEFTTLEKTEKYVNYADNIFTAIEFGVAIALAPATGGASLAGFAALKTATTVAKKTAKKTGMAVIKKITKKSMKYFSKNRLKSYTKKFYNKYNLKQTGEIAEKVGIITGGIGIGLVIGKLLFSKNPNFKEVCKENE